MAVPLTVIFRPFKSRGGTQPTHHRILESQFSSSWRSPFGAQRLDEVGQMLLPEEIAVDGEGSCVSVVVDFLVVCC